MNPIRRRRAIDRFLPMVAGLLVLPTLGVLGYRWIEGWPWMDAAYMTVETLSTVGFGEVHPLSTPGRLLTMGLIVCGGVFAAYAFTQLAHLLFIGEWRAYWENRRRLRMIQDLSNHVIVCGYGRVGRNVVAELQAEGLPFVVLDVDPARAAQVEGDGHLFVLGDAAHEARLREAGIERARGLVAAAKSDAENVFIVLTARSLRADLPIVARADLEESEPKLVRAGANRVILPYHITGRRLVAMLVRPHVADFLDEVAHANGTELVLEQVQIAPDSPLAGQELGVVQGRHRLDVTVLACKHADGRWDTRPRASTRVEAGSQLITLGKFPQLQVLIGLARPGSNP